MRSLCSNVKLNEELNIVYKSVSINSSMTGDELSSAVNSKYVLPFLGIVESDCPEEKIFVFPYAKGGDLLNFVNKRDQPLIESECKIVLKRVLKGILALHSIGLCHRDIKHQNIFLMAEKDLNSCVLADLGIACEIPEGGFVSGDCGTPFFKAPEIQKSSAYNEKVDMWSIGALAFYLLTRNSPSFDIEAELEKFIISENLKDLLVRLLNINPDMRISASDALDHPFFGKSSNRYEKILGDTKDEGNACF